MTTDDRLHLLGTKLEHLVLPVAIVSIGLITGIQGLNWFAVGMLAVLLFGNMRAQSPHYRWRVEGNRDE